MATFEDNTVVTAEDLNNIAVDLGATSFSAFSEEKFGVDKLNEITADLVSKGILATGNKCEPIVKDGKVYIKSGVIVFGSGAKIRIESPVEVGAAAGDYIYAFNDVATGKANIMTSAEIPTSGDYVMLAQLDSAGTVIDTREMSVANLTLSAELQNNYAEQTVYVNSHSSESDYIILECAAVPELLQCKYLIPKEKSESGMYFYPVELSEVYQVVYAYPGLSYSPRLFVKKTGGLLYFQATHFGNQGYFYGNFDFILA